MQQQDCSEIIVTRRLKCKKLPIISLPVDEANNKLQQSCIKQVVGTKMNIFRFSMASINNYETELQAAANANSNQAK